MEPYGGYGYTKPESDTGKGLGGIDPISILLGLGSSLFSGLGAAAKERKAKKKYGEKLKLLKPEDDYYGVERGLPAIDPIVQKVIMGMLGERGIPLGNLGVTPEMMGRVGGGRVPGSRRYFEPLARPHRSEKEY